MVNFFQKNEITWVNPNKWKNQIQRQKLEGEYSTETTYRVCGQVEDRNLETPTCRCDFPVKDPGTTCNACHHIHKPTQEEKIGCILAHYESYNSPQPKIVFHKKNMWSVFSSISPDAINEASWKPGYWDKGFMHEQFWRIMTNCIFYHELGHHLVQLFTENPKINKIPLYDEQKLCEYIAFKKTY